VIQQDLEILLPIDYYHHHHNRHINVQYLIPTTYLQQLEQEKLVQKLKYLVQQHLLDLEILEVLEDHLKDLEDLVVLVDLGFHHHHHLHHHHLVLEDLEDQQQ
tara:strand:- start:299 stop:607 length:309 start_codon:yes stop_codon:yes gene_type:complete